MILLGNYLVQRGQSPLETFLSVFLHCVSNSPQRLGKLSPCGTGSVEVFTHECLYWKWLSVFLCIFFSSILYIYVCPSPVFSCGSKKRANAFKFVTILTWVEWLFPPLFTCGIRGQKNS